MRNSRYRLLVLGLCWGILVVSFWTFNQRVVRVMFCDVGQGDGMIFMKGSWQMVVDVGNDNGQMLRCLSKYLPWWDKQIEIAVVTHQDKDHSGALASIYKYYRVKSLYSNQPQLVVNEQKFYAVKLAKNDVIRYDDIEYEVLNDDSFGSNENDNSLVGLWKYKDVSTGRQVKILLMGDVSSEVEERLVWRGALEKSTDGDIDVIKISHHGSDRATSKTLLDSVKPKRAVISVGKNNKFGHPSGRVQDDLMERSIKIDRTDIVGDVTVVY